MRKPESIQERMAQVRKAQAAGTYTRCPRCGENTMKLGDRLCTNALSRQYDIMVCDLCGMDEAVMAIMGGFSRSPTIPPHGRTLPPVAASRPAPGYFPARQARARHGANVGRI